MKSYQDKDPIHGHGKAMPQPKQETQSTPRPFALIQRHIKPGQIGVCCKRGCRTTRRNSEMQKRSVSPVKR